MPGQGVDRCRDKGQDLSTRCRVLSCADKPGAGLAVWGVEEDLADPREQKPILALPDVIDGLGDDDALGVPCGVKVVLPGSEWAKIWP